MREHDAATHRGQQPRVAFGSHTGARLPAAEPVVISHEAFEREAVIQRIVNRLRMCDLPTLEAVACILEQGQTCPKS